MNCRRVQQRLSRVRDGHPAGSDETGLAAHLRDCAGCRRFRVALLSFGDTARAAAEWPPAPRRAIRDRALSQWSAEQERPPVVRRVWPTLHAVSRPVALSLAGGLAVAAVLAGLYMTRPWDASQGRSVTVQEPLPPGPPPRNGEGGNGLPSLPLSASGRGPGGGVNPRKHLAPRPSRQNTKDRPRSITRHEILPAPLPPEDLPDDRFLDGRDPALTARWNGLDDREQAELDALRRQLPPAADDFVRIPLPRIAAGSGGGAAMAGAVREYKKEAKVVDARLFRAVTLRMKGASLADFAAQMEEQSGVRFHAGRDVADEKVTIFVKERRARDVMRAVARLFGYFWARSGEAGAYRYELLQDLKSRLAEEELRNRDAHAALLALDARMQKFQPYLEKSQEELEKITRENLDARALLANAMGWAGWAGPLIYPRLSPAERASLAAGQEIVFRPDSPDPERRMPAEWERRILQSWASGVDVNGEYKRMQDVPGIRVPQARLRINRSELGQVSLAVRVTATWPGKFGRSLSSHEVEVATGRGPSVAKPENRRANAALKGRSPFDQIVSLRPQTSCATLKEAARRPPEPPLGYGIHSASIGDLTRPHLFTADVWEALHRETGLPIVADYTTRMHRLDQVTLMEKSLFEALCTAADAMGVRWSKDGDFILCRGAGYLWDKLKEVPARHLRRWLASRDANGGLPLTDLLEMASMPDLQLDSEVVAEALSHCVGLPEWTQVASPVSRQRTRFLATLTPEQLRRAQAPERLPLKDLTAEQQQQAMKAQFAAAAAAERQNGEPSRIPPDWWANAFIYAHYAPAGWHLWTPPSVIPVAAVPVAGRTAEDALAAARRMWDQASPSQVRRVPGGYFTTGVGFQFRK